MNGGYLMISKNDSDIYVKAHKALTLGKPILFYENQTTCYYIDTISGGEITTEIVDDEEITSYGDIILTKGGKTITITSANAVSESGNIQQTTENFDALMENIVDSAGNKRFIEGDGVVPTIEGLTVSYCKWSLSGSHLMLVVSGTIADGTTITQYNIPFSFNIPKWIYDKIYPVWGSNIEQKSMSLIASNWSTQSLNMYLSKVSDKLSVNTNTSSLTLSADRSFRLQFDLLIDTEYSE